MSQQENPITIHVIVMWLSVTPSGFEVYIYQLYLDAAKLHTYFINGMFLFPLETYLDQYLQR
jgi:hypothetical protein